MSVAVGLFLALSGLVYWLVMTTNEDVPDPSWTDYLFVVPWILSDFPVGLFFPYGADTLAQSGFILGADSLFWGFVIVALIRGLIYFLKRMDIL